MGEAKRKKLAKPTPDSGLVILQPEEAANRMLDDPNSVYLPVTEFCRWAGLTPEQFRQEAGACAAGEVCESCQ